jgi:hypothetical protein
MNIYYVYAYLRSKDSLTGSIGTPYYIGRGVANRAWDTHRRNGKGVYVPTDKKCIIILKDNLTEYESKTLEIELISKYGRKDLGTGILENRTNGGEGTTGKLVSADTRNKQSSSMMGKNVGKIRSAETRQRISESMRGIPKSTRSEEHCKNMSLAKTGILQKRVTCPHCGKNGGLNGMNRFHFDKCRSK